MWGGRDHEWPIKGEARRAVRATPHPPLQWFTGRFCKRADVPKGTCCAAWASAPTEGADCHVASLLAMTPHPSACG